jgi:hypothetical protein
MSTTIHPRPTAAPYRPAPDRLTVPTCFGCGAMGCLGGCENGCHEERLDLVRAAALDELIGVRARAQACSAAFRMVAEELAWREPGPSGDEAALRAVRNHARAALHEFPDHWGKEAVLEGAAQAATTWWCADCGSVDAPQPCLEVCIWKPVEWVTEASYLKERVRAAADCAVEERLRALVRMVAWTTPRRGEWQRCRRALQEDARCALGAGAHRAVAA